MSDFYPYGMPLPGRQITSTDRQHGFAGEEKENELNYTHFELRQYDARAGRWLSPDPYGQFHSPYLALANNPVSFIDPDGGWTYDIVFIQGSSGVSDGNIPAVMIDGPFVRGRAIKRFIGGYNTDVNGYAGVRTPKGRKGIGRVKGYSPSVRSAHDYLRNTHLMHRTGRGCEDCPGSSGEGGEDDDVVDGGMFQVVEIIEYGDNSPYYVDINMMYLNEILTDMREGTSMEWEESSYYAAISKDRFESRAIKILKIRRILALNRRLDQNGGSGLPTRENGGFIENSVDFHRFMIDQAKNNPVEVAAFEINDNGAERYFVQPWKGNLPNESKNNFWYFNEGGYDRTNIISQYHTHPSSSGLSRTDAIRSSEWGIPVHSIGANGNMWRVAYPRGYMVPIYYGAYGERVR